MKILPLLMITALATSPLFADDAKSATKTATATAVKDVTPDEAEKLLKQNPKLVVLDVRTPEEFAKGHIAGAKNVDFTESDFEKKIAQLDKSQPYLLHCASGGRSSQALPVLEGEKFSTIYHLKSGFNGWEKAGKPVAK